MVGTRSGRGLGEEGSEAHSSFPSHVFLTGSRGREKGEFTNLQGVSAASSGRIVVADSNNQCIQVSRLPRPFNATEGSHCTVLQVPARR